MFQPAAIIETETFATLPNDESEGTLDPEWIEGQLSIMPPRGLLEGPSCDLKGDLYCVDVPRGRIYQINSDGVAKLFFEYDGWPCGLKIHKDGRFFIADHKHGLMSLDPINKKIQPLHTRYRMERFKALNDLFFASNGDLYFTDQGSTGLQDPSGRLFRMTAGGELSCLLDNIPSPNGLVMNLDESVIYVGVTRGNCVWRVPLLRNGMPSKVGVFIQLSGGWGPDGLALDSQGRLLVTHVGLGPVWIFDQAGEPVYRVVSRVGVHVTNIAYGGRDNSTLFITEAHSASILMAKLDVPGKTMYSHQ